MASTRSAHLTIGEVLGLLVEEFPDVTISKIRFLESQGLIDPERSPSGYRKFSDRDVDRLRYVMREQREHYLPLKVIKDRLDAIDATNPGLPRPMPAGASWATAPGGSPAVVEAVERATGIVASDAARATAAGERIDAADPSPPPQPAVEPEAPESASESASGSASSSQADGPSNPPPDPVAAAARAAVAAATDEAAAGHGTSDGLRGAVGASPSAEASVDLPPSTDSPANRRYTATELIAVTGADERLLGELLSFGLLHTETRGEGEVFDQSAVEIISIAQRFIDRGVEVRHLRSWRLAADKEAALFEQLVVPFVRQRNPQAREQAARLVAELSVLGGQLRGQLVRDALRQFLDP
jgi:DNA-binding transcriptional MerR regulator